ncbi:type II secretion system protein [Gracilibacillus salitolerans]|uniref:Type II secretion system protein n=1 Tax=Gracilibacillus salitolerans TaxID=2663022 RepID=A0A5Q2TJM1_9BACI|nr:type II secretion system F family protein [Gracilibacillus salitolerans]QGH34090.1 type II secretion system protein [Gracilibacillus salitolerans]
MLISAIFSIFAVGLVVVCFIFAGSKYKLFIEENKADFQFLFMAPASLWLIDRVKLIERLSTQITAIQFKVAILYSAGKQVPQYTKMFLAQTISVILLCLAGGSLFAVLNGGDVRFVVFAIILAIIIPFVSVKKLDEKMEKRKQDIIIELPEFASKIALLVNAGETVQQAIVRCTMMKADQDHPLYRELNDAVVKIKNGDSFNGVMEDFSKRCGVQEVSVFTTTILLNYKRGGNQLALSLRELSRDLWEKRKAISRKRGEEASSKLVFPMVLIFIAVLIIIAYPALRIF